MELRQIWHIIRRRWQLPVLLIVLTGLFSLAQMRPWQPAPPAYAASLRMLVGVLPAAGTDIAAYDPRYYAWLTSEYLVDDFTGGQIAVKPHGAGGAEGAFESAPRLGGKAAGAEP